MSQQDVIASGNNWQVSFDKETRKLVCSFNNELDESDASDSNGMVAYCEQCDRFFDVRSAPEDNTQKSDASQTQVRRKSDASQTQGVNYILPKNSGRSSE